MNPSDHSSLSVLIDAWKLEDVAQLVKYGATGDYYPMLNFASLTPHEVPLVAIRLDSLFNFLTDIILRDNIVTDQEWDSTWKEVSPLLDRLSSLGLLNAITIEKTDHFLERREYILQALHVPDDVIAAVRHHDSIGYGIEEAGKWESMVVGGACGYLSRSHILEMPYSPQPFRSHFLSEATGFGFIREDSAKQVLDVLKNQRVQVVQKTYSNSEIGLGRIVLAPIAVEVIESSSSISQMFQVAYELRDDYKRFRKSLRKFQIALDKGDLKELHKFNKRLASAEYSRILKDSKWGNLSLSIGTGGISIGNIQGILKPLQNRIGFRATLNKLLFTNAGEKSLEKVMDMLDVDQARLREDVRAYFRSKGQPS